MGDGQGVRGQVRSGHARTAALMHAVDEAVEETVPAA